MTDENGGDRQSVTTKTGSGERTRTLRSEQIGVLEAMRWYWKMVVACVVLLTGAGIGLALVRTPVYTSTATLNVDFAAQGPTSLSGSLSAAQASAEAYARAFSATALIEQVSGKTGIDPDTVVDRVSASAIPDNTIVLIDAKGDSASAARRLANISSAALIGYVTQFAGGEGRAREESSTILDRYRKISAEYNKSFAEQERLARAAKLNPTRQVQAELQQVKLETQVSALKRQGLFEAYTQSQGHYVAPLSYISRAATAEDDRRSKLQLLAFLGFVSGLAVGAALATLRANRTLALS
jgi:hypothetical protein